MTKVLVEKDLREKIGWSPHKAQQEILSCDTKEVVISAGRGFGKTFICSYEILKALLKGQDILLVAPTYDLCNRVLKYVDNWIRMAFPPLTKAISLRPPQTIDFRKLKDPKIPLGYLEARSAESPEGMLGQRFDLVVVDEAARIQRDVWETYIFPTTQITGGKQIYISTPRGKNTFHDLWVRANENGGAFRFESRVSPYFTDKDWEKSKELLPSDVFAQEYEAKFLSDAAAVFKGIDKVIKQDIYRDVQAGHRYIMGVDLGRKRDYTVVTVIDTYDNHIVYWDRFKQHEWPFQKKKLEATAHRYNNARIIIDSNNVGDAMVHELERDGFFVEPYSLPGGRSQKKKELIEKLSVFIENKNIIIPDEPILVDELKAFGYELTPAGRVKYQAPQGLHDDAVMSLAYAVSGLRGKANPKSPIKQELEKNYKKVDNVRKFI